MFTNLVGNLRFALRQLLKNKAFVVVAVLTVALGIGANTAIFTLIHSVMMKSLPVRDPETLVRLGDSDNCCVVGGYQTQYSIYSYPLYTYLRDNTPDFQQMAAFQAGSRKAGVRKAGDSGIPEPFAAEFVSGNYFEMLGIAAAAGRLISPKDDAPRATPVVVMSFRAWQHYGGSPSIVGSTFIIDGTAFEIAGIAPRDFFGETLRPDPPDFWLPLATEPVMRKEIALLNRAQSHWLYLMGRLPRPMHVPAVEAKVNGELRQWFMSNLPPSGEEQEKRFDRMHISLVAAGGGVLVVRQNYERDLRLLLMISGVVLLIACANVANLQMARGIESARQISIRVALGAARARVMGQVLTECILLALLGGAAGLLISIGLTRLLIAMAFSNAAYVPIDSFPDLPVLGAAFLLSVVTGTLFGIAPAWSASGADPAESLRQKGTSASLAVTRFQKSLVFLQAALSLALIAAAGLMVQTVRNLRSQQFGFNLDGRMVVNVSAGFSGYPEARLKVIYSSVDERLRKIPGVSDVTLALYSPMSGDNWQMGASVEDHPDLRIDPSWNRVSPSFFRTIDARIVRGRPFDEHDNAASTHVAIINESFAKKTFPNEDPIGKRFGLGDPSHATDYQIVGVVNNVLFRYPRQPEVPPMFFVPLLQMSDAEWRNGMLAQSNMIESIILRVAGNSSKAVAQVRSELSGIDPNLTILGVVPMQGLLDGQVQHERLIAELAELLGLLSLALASIGLYGVTSYAVARRTGEIGIRTALGATRAAVIRLVLSSALSQIVVGLLLGIPTSLLAGRLLSEQLYQVRSGDPVTLILAGGIVICSGAVAAIVPSLRASKVDPVIALRAE
jgi:predicted permease